MKYLAGNAPKFIMVAPFLSFFLSCSSDDTDLLAAYEDSSSQGGSGLNSLIVDDSFVTRLDQSTILDVLSNDMFVESDNVKIVETSPANNGVVVINEDNTLTYVPAVQTDEVTAAPVEETTEDTLIDEVETVDDNEIVEENVDSEEPEETIVVEDNDTETEVQTIDDSFTYTTETENEDGTVTTETGEVKVTVTNDEDNSVAEEEIVVPQGNLSKNYGELKAFPTAEGFGKYATGGRGGYIVKVTNLNDSGTGSLREALKMTGTRTIVFTVGGTINCSTYLDIPYKSGNVTIAGQTAPGDGILIKGAELRISASNVIVRYLKIRPGLSTSGSNEDGINISAYNGTHIENIVVDHCSISWVRDENFALVGGFSGSTIKKVTLQNSVISESGFGALNYKRTSNISYYGNFFAHNGERNIRSNNPLSDQLDFEMINNIVYGATWFTNPSLGTKFSVVNNKYKASREVSVRANALVNGENDGTGSAGNTHAYIEGNINPAGRSQWSSNLNSYIKSSAFASSGTSVMSANELETKVLPKVGASYPTRDAVDKRLVNQYDAGNGTLNGSGSYPSMSNTSRSSGYDSDGDGMADEWEQSMGLDSNDASDANQDRNGDGYTNLEDFLNDEVDF
ncbi:hypothetical protein [uncultured Kriegella sp.]|uniref:Ig-like domain-containing protein n=1 Tax=uncultured Kriegella sp. TaxID=1798910 RepID=UPI0030DA5300|tara:strand:- start:134480 stop:136354 length:1875 start_codon:yes stop_codon:yes gene_type:complete